MRCVSCSSNSTGSQCPMANFKVPREQPTRANRQSMPGTGWPIDPSVARPNSKNRTCWGRCRVLNRSSKEMPVRRTNFAGYCSLSSPKRKLREWPPEVIVWRIIDARSNSFGVFAIGGSHHDGAGVDWAWMNVRVYLFLFDSSVPAPP